MKKVLSKKYHARAKAESGELKTPQSQLEKPSIGVNGPAAEGGGRVATFNLYIYILPPYIEKGRIMLPKL